LSPRPGLAYLLAGATGLAALILLLPLTGTPEPERIARVAAYALVLACVVSLLHGFLLATRGYATPRVLALGAAAAGSGFLFAALVRPENLEDGSGLLTSFGLGASDFVFLALFAAASRFLKLRYSGTLLSVCSATLLAMIAGLLLERPLPALPFVAGACVLVNADLILASLTKRPRSSG
jgi:hypothetical protein